MRLNYIAMWWLTFYYISKIIRSNYTILPKKYTQLLAAMFASHIHDCSLIRMNVVMLKYKKNVEFL